MAGEDVTEPVKEEVVTPKADDAGSVPGEASQVAKWLDKIKAARKKHGKAFKRMKDCQQIAAFGAYKEWLDSETRYVVPIVNRHINQAVSQLYAKNPVAVAERRQRMLHSAWDGTQEQVVNLQAKAMMGDPMATTALQTVMTDIANAQALENMTERAAKTLSLLHQHQIDQQPYVFKTKIKQVVRRAKVSGVGYLKINFQREMGMRPETTAMMEDTVAKMRSIERLQAELQADTPGDDYDAKILELQTMLQDLQQNPDRVIREQITYDYPRAGEIILDPETRDLKTLEGCGWLAHEFHKTAAQAQDIWGVDIESLMSSETYDAHRMMEEDGCDKTYRFFEVQDKYRQQILVVGEGMNRFVKAPAEPDLWFDGFFNVFPLVFNEIEHDEEIYPPSDVWNARHMQFEYNRSRESLREHRIAARPYWLALKGRLEATEKDRLKNHAAHEIVEVMSPDPKMGVEGILSRGPTAALDPNLYETESINTDMLRSVGSQEANLGGVSGATATESSIAESSRMSSLSANVDDLDDFLTLVARATGRVLMQAMTKERVVEIIGPGAVWPELPLTRKELMDEITLKIRAGSSGRPNQAAKLANMERAWPALSQLPGINPEPLAEEYSELLDIDFEALNKAGAMSIVAMNAMTGPAPGGAATGEAPAAQGARGGERPQQQEDTGGQPAYPAQNESPPLA